MRPIKSIRVWWNQHTDNISLGEFLVISACENCYGNHTTVDLVVDRTFFTLDEHKAKEAKEESPDLHFRVTREGDRTIIERVPNKA